MGIVSQIHTVQAHTVMGIDSSTHSLAFAVFQGARLVKYGKIEFSGKSVYDRLTDAQRKITALRDQFDVDYIAIEKPVRVNSAGVAIKLAMFVGVIIASVNKGGTDVVEVYPMSWQSYIGNNNYTRAEKAKVKRRRGNTKKSTSAISAIIREERKQYTIRYFNKLFKINVDDNDVADSIGIAWYAVKNLTHE
jgi:Holliday junction resolvasome RuvABC endonuclease subunit